MTDKTTPVAPAHNAHQLIKMGLLVSGTEFVVALAGNPNTGKSTVFNALTGLHQHTGNWPGKTVSRAEGGFQYEGRQYTLVDLPGTYSLAATSTDEEIARDFVLFGQPDVTIVVVDATRLERNLLLALQVLEISRRVVICVNLVDEARRHGIDVDLDALGSRLGVPVVGTSARYGEGTGELLAAVDRVATGGENQRVAVTIPRDIELREAVDSLAEELKCVLPGVANVDWIATRLLDGDRRIAEAARSGELTDLASIDDEADGSSVIDAVPDPRTVNEVLERAEQMRWTIGPHVHQMLSEAMYGRAAEIADSVVSRQATDAGRTWDRALDRWLTWRWTGLPIMVFMLAVVLWLTVSGANVPSRALAYLLVDTIHPWLKSAAATVGLPWWIDGLLIDGCYLATAWVVSVMLPPMAIFFPLFTLLEDFGYLPRVAFNLDKVFHRCGAHGKQALTMCMGFGCNAAGVVAARIIDSPRERLIAIITNNFSLCNGRWPTQILVAMIFIGALAPAYLAGAVAALAVVGIALLGVTASFLVSWVLSRSMLRGQPSTFHLELPPYRPPRVLTTLYTSLIDRTMYVLWRAIVFALPAGAAIWLIANVSVGPHTLADGLISGLDPVAAVIGLNGVILVAYIVAIPANEIVIPTILMLTVLSAGTPEAGAGAGVMFEADSMTTAELLRSGGWTLLTGINLMLFSLLHNPCSTTIYTIWKETGSLRWTTVATLMPLVMGIVVCFVTTQIWRLFVG